MRIFLKKGEFLGNKFNNKYRTNTLRLKNYDYRLPGWYFVTICIDERRRLFGEIRRNVMGLSQIGITAHKNWSAIPSHFSHVVIDEFVIMANHLHGLIGLREGLDATESGRRNVEFNVSTNKNQRMSEISPKSGSLSSIIRSYKGSVTRWCNKNGFSSFDWQPKFYEHIVRNDASLNNIREYIYNNPLKWKADDYYI